MGQLISKRVGGIDAPDAVGLQKVDYKYNIRGWLTDINNVGSLYQAGDPTDLFAFKINYNTVSTDVEEVKPLYNGNIAETLWRTNSDNILRKYGYQYDALSRLNQAIYQKNNGVNFYVTNSYNESLSYDKNGNIMNLQRNGNSDTYYNDSPAIDNLDYQYQENSNKLAKVTDDTNDSNGFKDDSNGQNDTEIDYKYDANGNMVMDTNKGITSIVYNHLNLPTKITFNGNQATEISYLYNALGQKVAKNVKQNETITTDYLSGFQYKGTVLQFFQHAEGYVNVTRMKGGVMKFDYVFNYTDHLGNIRLSYGLDPSTNALKILDENHYYPFGLKHTNYNANKYRFDEFKKEEAQAATTPQTEEELIALKIKQENPLDKPLPTTNLSLTSVNASYNYKYNGKELQDELGLNMYDYGAMLYDPAIGRRNNVDPLAEKFPDQSPYSFVFNNPMRFVDPDGRAPFDWIKNNKTGAFVWDNNVTSASNTPKGYSYVGKSDNSIVTNLFGTNSSSNNSRDIGLISTEDFDNPHSASGAAFMNMSTNTTLSVSLSADVSTVYNKDGSVQSKDFKGININTSVSGDIVAPYPGVDISLVSHNMTLQGNEMKAHQTSPYGEIRQGGDVPTLTHDSYWNSSSIQSNFGKSFNLDFSFKGQYLNGNTPMSGPGATGLLGIPNTTSVGTSINFNNTAPAVKIDPNKL